MIERRLNIPTLGLIAGTRVALGMGLGLLLGERLNSEGRRACGWALFTVGALSTIPLAWEVLGGDHTCDADDADEVSSTTDRRRHVSARA